MMFYNGPDGMTAHCLNCNHLKIRHSFAEMRCPGTFEQGPVVQTEVRAAAQHEAARTAELFREAAALHLHHNESRRDAVAAAKELVERIDRAANRGQRYLYDLTAHCAECAALVGKEHYPDCEYAELRERILAAP